MSRARAAGRENHFVFTSIALVSVRRAPDTFGMLRSVIVASLLALTAAGCNSSIRSEESHACSTSPNDDPLLVCSPASDLICINTYTVPVTNAKEAVKYDGGIRSIFICRLACATDDECSRQEGDVCCPGPIYGKTYGKMGGCVPASLCNARGGPDDGGIPDAAPREDAAKLDSSAVDQAVDTAANDAARPADTGADVTALPADATTTADTSVSDSTVADAGMVDAPIDAAVVSPDASAD